MSLILDALRRADSERERGSVPSLHAQPAPPLPGGAAASPRFRHWAWIASGLAAGAVVVAIVWNVGREARRPPDGPAAVVAPAPPSSGAAPRAAPAAALQAEAVAAPPANPNELKTVAEPAPWTAREERKPSAAANPAPSSAGPPQASAGSAADRSPAEAPVYARDQLPESVRAQLPQLTIGGSIYSPVAANRSVIINGRVYREREPLSADLSLEQIKLNAAVLNYKGYRFEVRF